MPASRSIFTERVTDVSVNLLIVGDRFFALNRLDFGLDPRSTAIPSLNLLPARAAWKTARAIRRDRGFTSSCPPIIYASRNYLSQHLVEHLARQLAASLRVHAPFALTSDCAHALPRYFCWGRDRSAPILGFPRFGAGFPWIGRSTFPEPGRTCHPNREGSRGLDLTWNFPNPSHRFISGNGGRTVPIIRDSHASACESQDHGRRTTVPLHVFPVGKTTETYEIPPHLGVTCISDSDG